VVLQISRVGIGALAVSPPYELVSQNAAIEVPLVGLH
jgi:hypothetical protein